MVAGWTTFLKKHWAERQLRKKQTQYRFQELTDFNYFKHENIRIAEDNRNCDGQMVNCDVIRSIYVWILEIISLTGIWK